MKQQVVQQTIEKSPQKNTLEPLLEVSEEAKLLKKLKHRVREAAHQIIIDVAWLVMVQETIKKVIAKVTPGSQIYDAKRCFADWFAFQHCGFSMILSTSSSKT